MRIFTPRITSCIPGRKRFPEIEPLQRIEPGTQGVQFRIAAQIESPHLIVGKMQRGQIRKVFDSFERFYLHTTTRNRFHSKRLLPRYFAVPRNIVPHKIRFELRIGETDYFRRRELRDLRFCGNAASGNDDCPGTCVSNVNFCPEGKQRFILRGGQFDPVSLYFYLIDDIRLHLYLKLTGRSVEKIWAMVDAAEKTRSQKITTSRLNTFLTDLREFGHTVVDGKRRLRMHYVTQTGVNPPTFTFFVNHSDLVNDTYQRYVENRMRSTFDFSGTPIRLFFRKKEQKDA